MTDNSIFDISGLLSRLLVDHSTSKPDVIHNIFWATSDYEGRGKGYQYIDEITPKRLVGIMRMPSFPEFRKGRANSPQGPRRWQRFSLHPGSAIG